jgi:hypothetical protein
MRFYAFGQAEMLFDAVKPVSVFIDGEGECGNVVLQAANVMPHLMNLALNANHSLRERTDCMIGALLFLADKDQFLADFIQLQEDDVGWILLSHRVL